MSGKSLMIDICNFHVLSHLLLIYICKLHCKSQKEKLLKDDKTCSSLYQLWSSRIVNHIVTSIYIYIWSYVNQIITQFECFFLSFSMSQPVALVLVACFSFSYRKTSTLRLLRSRAPPGRLTYCSLYTALARCIRFKSPFCYSRS